jgi:phage gp36-like protein
MYCTRSEAVAAEVVASLTSGQLLQLDARIAAASGVVDSYLKGRFAVPIATPGTDIADATSKIAGYNFMCIDLGLPPDPNSMWKVRYDEAIFWLKDVAKGLATPENIGSTQAELAGALAAPIVITSTARGW